LVSLSPCLQRSAILGQRHGCLASPYVYQHRLDPKISRDIPRSAIVTVSC
jgi:hypothetical protein